MRRYIKHSRQCFIGYPNTSKFVKNTPLRVVFSTLFSVFGYPMKHCFSCLIYYINNLDEMSRNCHFCQIRYFRQTLQHFQTPSIQLIYSPTTFRHSVDQISPNCHFRQIRHFRQIHQHFQGPSIPVNIFAHNISPQRRPNFAKIAISARFAIFANIFRGLLFQLIYSPTTFRHSGDQISPFLPDSPFSPNSPTFSGAFYSS